MQTISREEEDKAIDKKPSNKKRTFDYFVSADIGKQNDYTAVSIL